MLFETIERYPVLTLELLKDSVKYDFEVIYQELTSPLHDLIPLSKIDESISKHNMKGSKVDSVKKALIIAIERY